MFASLAPAAAASSKGLLRFTCRVFTSFTAAPVEVVAALAVVAVLVVKADDELPPNAEEEEELLPTLQLLELELELELDEGCPNPIVVTPIPALLLEDPPSFSI